MAWANEISACGAKRGEEASMKWYDGENHEDEEAQNIM
jgi:hypothetical protein